MGQAALPRAVVRQVALVALLVLTGTVAPVLREEAASRLAVRSVPVAAAAVNRLPGTVPATQVPPPSPSGAHPPYPLNHTFDAERTFPGAPPQNHGFEDEPYAVGTPPTNHDLETDPTDVGAPPTNHEFATGDLTGWTAAGTVSIQSDPDHGYYARLGSSSTSGSVTSDAFVLDGAAQTFAVDLYYASATGYSGVEVWVLSGAGYATSTRVVQSLCYAWGR